MNPHFSSISRLQAYTYRLIQSLLFLYILLQSCSSLAQSKSYIDSLKTSFELETNDSLKVAYEMKLSREIHHKQHNEKKEYKHAQGAIDRALQLKDSFLYARALNNLGLLYRYHEQFGQALELHIKAFKLIQDKDVNPVYKMIFANNAGVAGRYNQKYDTAVSYYMKALKIAEAENNLKDIAISSNGLGNTLGNIPGREDETLHYFERSLKAEQKRNNTLGIAMNYLSIGDHYINVEDYKTARDYLKKLLDINQKRNDLFGLAITYEYTGISYLKEGKDLDKSVFYFQKSLNHFKDLNNKHKQAQLLTSLGNTYFKKEKFNRAEKYYRQSLSISENLDQFDLIRANAHKLSQVLENRKNYKSALSYRKLSEAYEDSINLKEQNVKIEALTRKYNIKKKESHIQLLEKDKALQQAVLENQKEQLERRQIISILLGVGFIFILIIFLLQYRNYRTKKKTNARITIEEKEKMNAIYERNIAQAEILVTRLRVNPHFLFNSLNAITYLIQSEQNAKAIKYLKIFSRYTRMVLETSKQQVIPLEEELKLAHYYLMLEENRFEKDFIFKISGDDTPGIEDIFIPPLLLQPFLENAIWHGLLLSQHEEKMLSINITLEDNSTRIIIDDNGVGRENQKKKNRNKTHKSMGMQIVKERIELHNKSYASKINYQIIDKKDDNGEALGTQIILDLQQNHSDQKADTLN